MIFKIDLKIFIIAVVYYFTKQLHIFLLIMMFDLFHELGHMITGIILGMKVKQINIMPVGFSIKLELKYSKDNKIKNEVKKILIAIMGPAVNAIIIIICIVFKTKYYEIIYLNIAIVLFNMLPIYPLDGGRILKSFFTILFKRNKAIEYISRISNVLLCIISILFSILIIYYKNFSLSLIIIYLWYILINENKIYKARRMVYEISKNL